MKRLNLTTAQRDRLAELLRFAVVGCCGYAINLVTFAATHRGGLDYRACAALAFLVAVTNNFFLHRRWTFGVRGANVAPQAARFLLVALIAFAVNLAVLDLLVRLAAPALVAQATAVLVATPVNFAGTKLWCFGLLPRLAAARS